MVTFTHKGEKINFSYVVKMMLTKVVGNEVTVPNFFISTKIIILTELLLKNLIFSDFLNICSKTWFLPIELRSLESL